MCFLQPNFWKYFENSGTPGTHIYGKSTQILGYADDINTIALSEKAVVERICKYHKWYHRERISLVQNS